jgi:sugar lactone lactonase YvrE
VLLFAGVPLALVAAYAIFAPDVISPREPWDPPAAPALEGVLEQNEALQRARLVARGKLIGPESIARDASGALYTGIKDGRIVKVDVARDELTTFARTGTAAEGCGTDEMEKTCGRVLGARFDAAGNLIVADAFRGLLSIDPSGRARLLTSAADGVPFGFTDDLDIAKDGRIYFSDASSKWDRTHYREDILENEGWGRLLRYDPAAGTTEVLLGDLYFANGVQLLPDESAVLVVETGRYRIRRYYLQGEKAGTSDFFAENLPGMPDNIRLGSNGTYWLAMGAKRSRFIDFLHPRPTLKRVLAKILPLRALQKLVVPKLGFVVQLDANGAVSKTLWDTSGQTISEISEVDEYDGKLYIGSIGADRIAVLDL